MRLIAQASKDENGLFSGGIVGDQTGKEVFIRDWYDGNWHTVLRPNNENLIQKSVDAAIYLCNSNIVGYDQRQRNTLHTQLLLHRYDYLKIHTPCECDCSSFVTALALIGGAKKLEYAYNAPVTGNMVEKFSNTGMYEVITDEQYLRKPDLLLPGDILVSLGHTIIVIQ